MIRKEATSSSSALSLETVLRLIPEFDTAQNSQVYRFIRSCSAAFKLSQSADQDILLIYVLNKIIGPYSADVHARQYASWDVLQTFLIEKFSNVKTIAHLTLELQSLFQKEKETVTDYFHRVELLRSKIIEKLSTEINDESLLGRRLGIEECAMNVFVNGLNSDIGAMLRTKEFKHLSDAGRFAMQEEKIRAMNDARQRLYRINISPNPRSLNNPKPSNYSHNYNNSPRPQFSPRPPTTGSSNPPNQKFCNYCKNFGHIIHHCKKRIYNQNQNSFSPKSTPVSKPINNLNYQAAIEQGELMETASAHFPSSELHLDFEQKLQME